MTDMISREAAIAKFTAMLPDTEKHRKIDLHAVIDYLSALPAVTVKPLVWEPWSGGISQAATFFGVYHTWAGYWRGPGMAAGVAAAEPEAAAQADYAARIMSAFTGQEGV